MTVYSRSSKRIFIVALIILLITTFTLASQESITKEMVNWKVQSSDANGFTANISLDNSRSYGSSNSIFNLSEDEGFDYVSSTFIAVPNGKGLQIEVAESDINKGEVTVGSPFVFRGIRLFPLQLKPTNDMLSNSEVDSKNMSFRASFIGSDSRANASESNLNFTAEGLKFLRTHIMNLDELDLNVVAPLGRILIMVQDHAETIANLQPYIQWKTQQGYKVVVESSANPSDYFNIKSKINEHYTNDDPIPLEYILMIGDHDGSIRMVGKIEETFISTSDYPYTLFSNEDSPVGTVAIGRFSVNTQNQLQVVVKKTVTYERDVYMENTSWLNNVILTAGEGSGISPIETNQRIKHLFADRDISADTLWYTMNNGMADSEIPEFIVEKINSGASFLNYRGYYGMSQWSNDYCNLFTNENKLPVIITITCDTGTWGGVGNESFIEGFLRAGTYNHLKGGVAAIGTSTSMTHTCYNNVVDVGIFDAVLQNNVRSLGWALVSAKYRLWEAYNGHGQEWPIQSFSNWNNLMGDPALRMWVGVPQIPTVSHLDTVRIGDTSLDVTVSLPGEWPELVWATIATDDSVIDSRIIPNSGNIRLYFDNLPEDENVYLTICGDNVVPQVDTLRFASADILLVTTDIVIDDGDGGDLFANPGETISLDITVTNSGTEEISGATASIISDDPLVNLTTANSFDVPTLVSGASTTIEDAVVLEIDGHAHDGYQPELTLLLNSTHRSAVKLALQSWVATNNSENPSIDGGELNPGETNEIVFPIKNVGSKTASGLTGNLTSSTNGITINNSERVFSDMDVNGSSNNISDPFSITASNTLRLGQKVDFTLQLTDARGAKDSTQYSIYLGDPAGNGLTGPGEGYWAIDESDIEYTPQMDFEWVDIETTTNRLDLNDTGENGDASTVVNLPFTFSYFGDDFNVITICTNGWAAFGDQGSYDLHRNWPIPSPMGPEAMLAPFWDNLVVYNTEGVFTFSDLDNHLFIITWDCYTAGDPWVPESGEPEKFQIVLFDPAHYQTSTGNGIILFQYAETNYPEDLFTDNPFMTIGIESPDSRQGVMYDYWHSLEPGATEIGDEDNEIRTIVFTDDLTANFSLDIEDIDTNSDDIPTEFAISDIYPNPFNPSTTISIALPNSGHLSLKIFNLLGQEVALLASDHFNAGMKQFSFNADKMASGIYFVKATLPGKSTQIKKVMLVR